MKTKPCVDTIFSSKHYLDVMNFFSYMCRYCPKNHKNNTLFGPGLSLTKTAPLVHPILCEI